MRPPSLLVFVRLCREAPRRGQRSATAHTVVQPKEHRHRLRLLVLTLAREVLLRPLVLELSGVVH